MKRVLFFVFLLLSACVQIPDSEESGQPDSSSALPEEQMTLSDSSEEEVVQEQVIEQVPVQNAAPLAPLPEPPKNITQPSAPLPQPTPQQKSMPSGWTTEPLSIAEGETKVYYIKT